MGPGRAGARRELSGHTAPFLASGALQGEGLYLQRVHRLLPRLLPAPGILRGQRDNLCGWLLLPQRYARGGVGAWQPLPGLTQMGMEQGLRGCLFAE